EIRDKPGQFLSGERLNGHDRAVLHELVIGFSADNLFDADGAEDFHRALADLRGPRMNRRSAVMFDSHRMNTMMSEQQRRRQSDKTPADNQNRYFEVSHYSLVLTRRSP